MIIYTQNHIKRRNSGAWDLPPPLCTALYSGKCIFMKEFAYFLNVAQFAVNSLSKGIIFLCRVSTQHTKTIGMHTVTNTYSSIVYSGTLKRLLLSRNRHKNRAKEPNGLEN